MVNLGNALVVEDDYLIALDLRESLMSRGFKSIEMVANAEDALARVQAGGLDLVTLDIKLADETSDNVAAALHAQGTPFIIVTAYRPSDALQVSGAPWITKPFDEGRLQDAIETVVKRGGRLPSAVPTREMLNAI